TARCEATVPVQVTRCASDAIELVLADPLPPTGFEPCTWPTRGPTHIERWQRD
ncbi:MAG: hypothetical protein H7138_25580, partial [Myxococcales bacterium]|nr:hypothetical protein [Myxococcales bacterium]